MIVLVVPVLLALVVVAVAENKSFCYPYLAVGPAKCNLNAIVIAPAII